MGKTKYTIQKVNEIIKNKGTCLSDIYTNTRTKMLWQCNNKHQWSATWSDIRGGHWCPYCAGVAKNTIETANSAAKSKNGKCLSKEYKNTMSKLLWECKFGHQWKATLNKVKDIGRWCPHCAGVAKKTLKECKEFAKSKNGKCLSKEYKNITTNMKWQCEKGHTWCAKYGNIKNDHWCPYCSRNKIFEPLNVASEIAKKHDGVCLSTVYLPGKKLRWQCKKGHIWEAKIGNLKNNNAWCIECGYLSAAKKLNISFIRYHWKTKEELVCQGSWEARVVDYFNRNKIEYKWQPKTFKTPIKRPKTEKLATYRPDLYLLNKNIWVEIKGYFRKDAKEKWEWFHKEKPNSELWDKTKLEDMGIL